MASLRFAWLSVVFLGTVNGVIGFRGARAQQTLTEPQGGASSDVAGYVLFLPTPISPTELDRYASILSLSAEQSGVLESLWDAYIVDFNALQEERRPGIQQLARDAQQVTDASGYISASVDLHREFQRSQAALMDKCAVLDRQLLDGLTAVLANEQQERLERVRWHRERARGHTMTTELPSANIDLSWIVEQFQLPGDDMARVESTLGEYESSITPLVVAMRRDTNKRAADYAALLNAVLFDEHDRPRDFNAPEHQIRHDEFAAATERLFGSAARQQAQLVSLNRQFAPRIAAALPDPAREQFLRIYRSAAYPDAYSDPVDPRPAYNAALALSDFDNEHRQAAAMLWQAYIDAYNAATAKMELAYDEFQESVARTMTSGRLAAYQAEKLNLERERWRRTGQFVEQMLALLTPAQRKLLAPELDRCEGLLRQMQAAGILSPPA